MEAVSSECISESGKYLEVKVAWQGIKFTIRQNPTYYVGDDGFITQHIEVRSADRGPLPLLKPVTARSS